MFGCEVKDMLMARITQECTALHPSAQVLGNKGHLAPLGHHPTDVETPVGVEVIDHPIVTLHLGQLRDDIGQVGGEIGTGTCWPQIPYDLPRGHHKRGNQHPCAMTDVLVLAFFRLARGDRLVGDLQRRTVGVET